MPFRKDMPTVCGHCGLNFLAARPASTRPPTKYCSSVCSHASKALSVVDRFWTYAQKVPDGCWNWSGYIANVGYGQMQNCGKLISAHRVSWEIHNGPIPKGLEVCHHCDNRACVNPQHLFLGTHHKNMLDMAAKGRYKVPGLRGEQHPRSVLKEPDVLKIKSLLNEDRLTQRQIAEMSGTSIGQVKNIKSGKTWQWLT